jgi:hypothetical protein
MKKYNKQQRQLGALIRFYRRHTPWFLDAIRNKATKHPLSNNSSQMLKHASRFEIELRVLESRLPPEMVAWAKINR